MPNGHVAPIASATGAMDGRDSVGQPAENEWSRSGAILTRRRRFLVLSGLLAASVVVIVLCSSFGAAALTGSDWLAALRELATPGHGDSAAAGTAGVILFQLRVPRVLMGFLVGGVLAAVGVTLQALLRNALADPYVLGVSSGAALGAAVAMLLGIGATSMLVPILPLWGFAGGLIALVLIYRMAQSHGRLPIHSLLLAGVILNAILTAVIMFITSIMEPARSAGLMAWLMGSLTAPGWTGLMGTALYVIVGITFLLYHAPVLNVLTQGEETARSLGIDTERTKKRLYALTALLTGAVVSVSGMIGFVGMVIPHAVRMAIGSDHRLLMPASVLVGGMFLVVSDTVARTAFAPAEIPVGVVTALAGGPFFLYLLLWRKDRMV
ncbi:MAG: iron ABC transporter permease [Nitrospira sp.]|nr:iron ABC transporter permease [Nitrospira sp.]MDH4328277.1 iron ABC transporter permease [Nitrospira sp.]MDH5253404.1 iron ABC transporter permease [Nitrospira sp.]